MPVPSSSSHRILGYDLARALALLGMVVVNYTSMLEVSRFSPAWLEPAVDFLYGRAAVVFVMLAGVSVSLMADRHPGPADLRTLRGRLMKKSLLLMIAGLALWPWWAADILHFYAVFIAVGAWAVAWNQEFLRRWAAAVLLISLPICATLTAAYDFSDAFAPGDSPFDGAWLLLDYFTSPYYPVFPWLGFFLAGMSLGRWKPSHTSYWWRAGLIGVLGCLGVELVSSAAIAWANRNGLELEGLWWCAFLRSEAFPVTPLFIISSAFSGLALICFCRVTTFSPRRTLFGLKAIAACGRLSLTLYVAHIGWGMLFKKWVAGPNIDIDYHELFLAAAAFGSFSIVFASIWLRHFQRGPLEMLFHWFTHGRRPSLKGMDAGSGTIAIDAS